MYHETYEFCGQINKAHIIQRHSQYIHHNFKLDVIPHNTQLPSIYSLSKLQKNLFKARYVIVALRYILKLALKQYL